MYNQMAIISYIFPIYFKIYSFSLAAIANQLVSDL